MERQEVSLKKEDGVALLRIERPKRLNALSRDIVKQIDRKAFVNRSR